MVPSKGGLILDDGASQAVRHRAKSLFSAGIVSVQGEFNAQDAVEICDSSGTVFALGLSNYCSSDLQKIKVSSHRPLVRSCRSAGHLVSPGQRIDRSQIAQN